MTRRVPPILALLLLTGAVSEPEAPPPETPGAPIAEAAVARAQEEDGELSWFALPMAFWLPETRLGAAVTGGVHFRLSDAPRASNAFLVAGYTILGQGSVDASSDLVLRGGTVVSGRFRAVHYKDAYYGVGPETTLGAREEMTRRFLELGVTAGVPVLDRRLRVGPRLNARAEELRDVQPGGEIAAGELAGAHGFTAVGFGFEITWDSRDRPLWPTRGGWAQASYLHYPSSIGRDAGFGRSSLEGRLFLPLGRDRVLGVAGILEETYGDTPFTLLAKLGSTRYLRGIREGRYRDALAWAAQAELRLPLTSRLYGALFGAFGDVGPDLGALSARTLKVAGGGGVRVRLTEEGANLRVDLAGSDAGPEVYVLLLEAF